MATKIAALVVTYNRKALLRSCLNALFQQTRRPDVIYVIDNASTDGTEALLDSLGYLTRDELVYRRLRENAGGAGGFHAGVDQAVRDGNDWIWLMDDDAEPDPGALLALEQTGLEAAHCYGSSAIFDSDDGARLLCWPAEEADSGKYQQQRIRNYDDLPDAMRVTGLPFLGFMVNRETVERVGLPEAGYFISGEDMDYSERIRKAGTDFVLVKASLIKHPRPADYTVRFMAQTFFCVRMPPWRRYYNIRNRVLNGRRHYGIHLVLMTLPGIFVRWGATLVYEPGRWRQSLAYARGIVDGLCNRLGKRWEPGH